MSKERTVLLRTTSFSVEAGEAAVGARPATAAGRNRTLLGGIASAPREAEADPYGSGMGDQDAIAALVSDLHWQIDQRRY